MNNNSECRILIYWKTLSKTANYLEKLVVSKSDNAILIFQDSKIANFQLLLNKFPENFFWIILNQGGKNEKF